MVGERRLFRGGEPGSRQAHLRWVLAIGMGAGVSACSLVANLGQFDGAQLAEPDAGAEPDGAETADSAGQPASDAAPDGTMVEMDAVGVSDDVVVQPDTSVDQGLDASDATVADAGDATLGTPDDSGSSMDGGPCMPNWPTGTNLVPDPDFEPGSTLPDGGTGWYTPYGGVYSISSTESYCGTSSGHLSMRMKFFDALGLFVDPPTGTFNTEIWAMQQGDGGIPLLIGTICIQNDGGTFYGNTTTAVTAEPGEWVSLSGPISFPDYCVQSTAFVGQPQTWMGPFNDIYVDEAYIGQ
ncbi:MAG TPA: hypothetical protein VK841_25630 [Polyangiaceae bacterium]|jgi:hypothetical protein|nr:hypothetical protein [Polyangiaceae bacterium]